MNSPDQPSWNSGGSYPSGGSYDPYGTPDAGQSPYASTDSGLPYGYVQPSYPAQGGYGQQPNAYAQNGPAAYQNTSNVVNVHNGSVQAFPAGTRKDPALMLLASFFIPGLGSMLNGEVGKGVGILVGYIVSFVMTIFLVGFVGLLGFWIWGLVDAYQGAVNHNRRHGIFH